MKRSILIFLFLSPVALWGQVRIEGIVKDEEGLIVAGASITNEQNGQGTITDLDGKFVINCPEACLLRVSHVNFETVVQKMEKSGFVEIGLKTKSTVLDELSIEAFSTQTVATSDLQKIEHVSAIFGEKDILKYLITLPGISSISTFDAGITVRGGSTSENAFLIDGMAIADPRHLTTLVTSYDAFILGKSSIYKSGQPAQYNGFLSGYIDMSPEYEGAFKPQGELSVGLISSSIKGKIPFGKKRNHLLAVSARQSYLHLIAKMYEQKLEGTNFLPDYSLSDLTFTYQGRINGGWDISAVGLLSEDDLPIILNENQSHQLNWNTASGIISVEKNYANQDQLSFKIAANQSDASDVAQGRILQSMQSDSRSYSGSVRYLKNINSSWHLYSGAQHESKEFHYFDIPDGSNPLLNTAQKNYGLSTLFVDSRHYLGDWSMSTGLNFAYYDGDATRTNLSPRVKISYLSNWELWADYARTLQFEERLPFFTIRSPIDMPIPLGESNKPAVSDQFSLGAAKSIVDNLNLSASLFFKHLTHLKDFANSSRSNLDFISIEMIEGKGHAYGLESELSYTSGKFQSRISYTLLQSKRQFDQINNGQVFSPPYDVTNSITIQGNYQISRNWSAGALWTYTSGIYVTIPEGIAVAKDITRPGSVANYVPIYSERYNYRIPARHRLDLSLDYLKKFENNALKLSMGTYNTYGRENVDFIYLEVQQADDYLIRFVPKSKLVLPFVPYISLTFYINNHGS